MSLSEARVPSASAPSLDHPLSQLYTGKTIARHLVQIPKEQIDLLDRDDAWRSNLHIDSRGQVNVPPIVLENLREFYARLNAPSSPEGPSASVDQVSSRESDEDSTGDSSEEEPIPWSASQHSQVNGTLSETKAKGGDAGDDAVKEVFLPWTPTPIRQAKATNAEVIKHPQSPQQVTSPTQALPRIPRTTAKHAPVEYCFPSSSIAVDEELEIEVPGAIKLPTKTQAQKPSKEGIVSPPSAQVQVIPCTYGTLSSPPQHGQQKRRRLMKKPNFDYSDTVQKPLPSFSTASKLPSARLGFGIGLSSSASTSDPSVVAATAREQSSQPRPINGGDEESVVTVGTTHASPKDSRSAPRKGSSCESDKHDQGKSGPELPFATFTAAYPGYNGSAGAFVRACFYIQMLQRKRSIPSFIYDDFIRVFSDEYLSYIGELDDSETPMTAVEWYNENVEEQIFKNHVVTKSNLHDILQAYPGEVKKACRFLGGQGSSTEFPGQHPTQDGADRPSNDVGSVSKSITPRQSFMAVPNQDAEDTMRITVHTPLKNKEDDIPTTAARGTSTHAKRPLLVKNVSPTTIPNTQHIPDTIVNKRPSKSELTKSPAFKIPSSTARSTASTTSGGKSKRKKKRSWLEFLEQTAKANAASSSTPIKGTKKRG